MSRLVSATTILFFLTCTSLLAQNDVLKYNVIEGDTVYEFSETVPEFPGGQQALFKHLATNIKYPKEAIKGKIEGKVFVNFVVDDKGNVKNVTLKRGIGGGCDEEAMRVVEELPAWQPGTIGGKAVSVQYVLPIVFKL